MDKVKAIGPDILLSMIMSLITSFKFRNEMKMDFELVQVDYQLLFQLLTIAASASENVEVMFQVLTYIQHCLIVNLC